MFSKKNLLQDVHWINKYYMYIEFEVEIGAKIICSSRYQYKYMYKGFIHCYFYHCCASFVFFVRFFRNSVTVNDFQHYEKTVLQ